MADKPYRRILFKCSGEVLMGDQAFGIDMAEVDRIAGEIAEVAASGIEIGLVIGGGNLFRGVAGAAKGMDRAAADQMGMLATVMNALAMENALNRLGTPAVAMSAIPMPTVCEPYTRKQALAHLERGRIVLFAAGTGNPFFTTDTAAALRAAEINCQVLLKGTSVDGIYAADPKQDPQAQRFERISYSDVISRDLKVMDASAITLARDNGIPVIVFSVRDRGMLQKVASGGGRFTIVTAS